MGISSDHIWQHLDGLTKPPRSLGRLEELAARLCLVQQTLLPQTAPRRLVIFTADHGVASAGVTIWPSSVTSLMVRNMCAGGAASTVMARQTNTEVILVNVGTADEPMSQPPQRGAGVRYRSRRVRAGTRNLAEEPALTVEEFWQGWNIGAAEARAAVDQHVRIVLAGEMGIGNTTPTACLAMLLADLPVLAAVGRGAGADDITLERKRNIVEKAVARARTLWNADSLAAIAAVSGVELAAMAGFYAEAAAAGLTVILDGAVASAAALIAEYQSPGTARSMIAAHLSTEPSHSAVLAHLDLTPFLDWGLRLGEGTGALLLLPLLDAAAAISCEMASLQSLGISPKVNP
jgi:nicotinate-nucleotide--dimethylbenzimidazole phosphoribosyltransferase